MLLGHHAIPLSVGHLLIIIGTEFCISFETTVHFVCPTVTLGILFLKEFLVHGLCIIHLMQIAHGLNREQDNLPIGILIFR